MNTTHNTKTKRLVAALGAAAAVVAPAVLFAGAGTAHAAPDPSPANVTGNGITVNYANGPGGLGLDAFVRDMNNSGAAETCRYFSNRVSDNGLPFWGATTVYGNDPGALSIPGIWTGTNWNVTVDCDSGSHAFFSPITY